jgi:predicted secreted hydrolase
MRKDLTGMSGGRGGGRLKPCPEASVTKAVYVASSSTKDGLKTVGLLMFTRKKAPFSATFSNGKSNQPCLNRDRAGGLCSQGSLGAASAARPLADNISLPFACPSTRPFVRRFGILFALPAFLAVTIALLAGCGAPGTIHGGGTLAPVSSSTPTTAPLPPVRFPQDEAPHQDMTEWWYYTGHLHGTDAQGKTHIYGFELTFFQTLRGSLSPYYAAHFAISDITSGQFYYDQREGFLPSSVIPAHGSTNGFNLTLGGWTMRGLNGHDQLAASLPGYSIALSLTDQLPHAILHGGNGIISYGASGFSYYYSRPLMAVTGTINDHGTTITVTGQAWMDHQWGNFLSLAGAGWDWYSIQLSNHTEYMLYVIRDSAKRPVSVFGTAVAADGSAHEITASAIQTQATGSWKSPVTGGVYPSGWRVMLSGSSPLEQVSLTLTPLLKDQELVTAQSTGVAYWEGAVAISGQAAGQSVTGEGYVELTGYAQVPSGSNGGIVP